MADEEAGGGDDKKDEPGVLTTCCYSILDFFAMIFRCLLACGKGIYTCIKHCVYPIKETCLQWIAACSLFKNPWRRKTPYTHVPKFSYDSQALSSIGS